MPQALKPLCLIGFWNWKNSLFSLLALWGNKNWPPSIRKDVTNGKLPEQNGLKGLQMVQFAYFKHLSFYVFSLLEVRRIPILILPSVVWNERFREGFDLIEANFEETKANGDSRRQWRFAFPYVTRNNGDDEKGDLTLTNPKKVSHDGM